MTKKAIIIQTTFSDNKDANKLSNYLIKAKLASCIQSSKINSNYLWKNKICKDKEILLNIKTSAKLYKKVRKYIKKYHTYDTPEIISIKIKDMDKKYKKWFLKDIK